MSSALIILCHPSSDSLNASIAQQVQASLTDSGLKVHYLDLYREDFDPIISNDELSRRFSFDDTVQHYVHLVTDSHFLIFIHPDWWGNLPALLKGWIERVMRPGIAYDYDGPEFGKKSHIPLLTSHHALAIVTSDQPIPESGHPLSRIWEDHVFAFCGMRSHGVHILGDLRNTTWRQRKRWIRHVLTECSNAAPLLD